MPVNSIEWHAEAKPGVGNHLDRQPVPVLDRGRKGTREVKDQRVSPMRTIMMMLAASGNPTDWQAKRDGR